MYTFKDPLRGKRKYVTYGMFAGLGALAVACYYRAVDIGKSLVVNAIGDTILGGSDALLEINYDNTKRNLKIRCTPEKEK